MEQVNISSKHDVYYIEELSNTRLSIQLLKWHVSSMSSQNPSSN